MASIAGAALSSWRSELSSSASCGATPACRENWRLKGVVCVCAHGLVCVWAHTLWRSPCSLQPRMRCPDVMSRDSTCAECQIEVQGSAMCMYILPHEASATSPTCTTEELSPLPGARHCHGSRLLGDLRVRAALSVQAAHACLL